MWWVWFAPSIVVVAALLVTAAQAHELRRGLRSLRRDTEALTSEVAALREIVARVPRLRR